MNKVSHPDASRLVYRIRSALTGESGGQETAKLAWQFAEAIERANRALAEAQARLAEEQLLEALEIEAAHPALLESAAALDFAAADAWTARCATYSWRQPSPIDSATARSLREALAADERLKSTLYELYRSAQRAKDGERAFRTIRQIASRFPEDPESAAELQAAQHRLLQVAEAAILASVEELIPAENTGALLARYRRLDLPLGSLQNPVVARALAAEESNGGAEATARIHSALAGSDDLSADADWRAVENRYFECDYALAIAGARGRAEPEAKARFEELGLRLARLRNSFEAMISLRASMAELKSAASARGNSKLLAQRLERLRSLEKQAIRLAGQTPPELQKELRETYAMARHRWAPAVALASAAAVALVAGGLWIGKSRARSAALDEESSRALASLQEAEEAADTEAVRSLLATFDETIVKSEAGSPLREQALVLEDWLQLQNQLEQDYAQRATAIEQLAASPDPETAETELLNMVATADQTRRDLAADRGQEHEQRIRAALGQWNTSLAQARQQREQTLRGLQRELETAAEGARKAKARPEFQDLQAAVSRSIAAIQTVAEGRPDDPATQRLLATALESQQQLDHLNTKWDALDRERVALETSTSLDEYLTRLKRIHSFDILSADLKAAIEQSLRLESAFGALKRRALLPNELGAWSAFSSPGDYAQGRVELGAEESAYLDRMRQDEVFAQVYRSTVQYFEGSGKPQSEYQLYLVEPISKSDSQPENNSINFAFKVRGFNEMGYPEARARDIQFISQNDGSFWGFFYKPSELSPESEYYRNSIAVTLRQLTAGARRMAVMEQLGDLEKQTELSPAFRAYWQQRFLEFMSLEPWKWGLALSPSLQQRAERFAQVSGGEISERLWLSLIEQTVPSPELEPLLAERVVPQAQTEARAFAALYQNALAGDFELVGFVSQESQLVVDAEAAGGEPLWTVNTLTGRVEKVDSDLELAPLAPVLRYRYQSGGKDALLKRVALTAGFDFAKEHYAPLMPPLFH